MNDNSVTVIFLGIAEQGYPQARSDTAHLVGRSFATHEELAANRLYLVPSTFGEPFLAYRPHPGDRGITCFRRFNYGKKEAT